MSSRLVSVVVPVFNERESLVELHERLRKVLEQTGERYEILFVDDGSADGSAEVIRELRQTDPRVGLVRHLKNHGKSLALMQGFAAARGDVAIMLDADLQDEPEHIPAFLARLDEGADLVNGRRTGRKDGPLRRLVSWLFNWLVCRIFKLKVRDMNCGYKAMRRGVYQRLELRGDLHRLIPVLAASLGHPVVEIPITHSPRKHGRSKYRLLRHRGLLDIFALLATRATRLRPFHVFSELALLSLFVSLGLFVLWGLFCVPLAGVAGAWHGVMTTLCLIAACFWLFMAGLLVPVGYLLEVLTAPQQDATWRDRLVVERVEPEADAES